MLGHRASLTPSDHPAVAPEIEHEDLFLPPDDSGMTPRGHVLRAVKPKRT